MTISIKPEIINKLRYKNPSFRHGDWQIKVISEFIKTPVGMTARDLARKIKYNVDLTGRVCAVLVKRGILVSHKARLFNSKAHGQQLIYFLND